MWIKLCDKLKPLTKSIMKSHLINKLNKAVHKIWMDSWLKIDVLFSNINSL